MPGVRFLKSHADSYINSPIPEWEQWLTCLVSFWVHPSEPLWPTSHQIELPSLLGCAATRCCSWEVPAQHLTSSQAFVMSCAEGSFSINKGIWVPLLYFCTCCSTAYIPIYVSWHSATYKVLWSFTSQPALYRSMESVGGQRLCLAFNYLLLPEPQRCCFWLIFPLTKPSFPKVYMRKGRCPTTGSGEWTVVAAGNTP